MTIPEVHALLLGMLHNVSTNSDEVRPLIVVGCLIFGIYPQVMGISVLDETWRKKKSWAWYPVGAALCALAFWAYLLAFSLDSLYRHA